MSTESIGFIGFIGFGEAASHIARGLCAQGVRVVAFDINAHSPALGDVIQQRAAESQAVYLEACSKRSASSARSAGPFGFAQDAAPAGANILATETVLVESLAELAQASEIVLCAVTAQSAVQAATDCATSLTPRHIYADLNSVSPTTKRLIAEQIASSGAHFVEVAVMAPVPPYGHRVPMLLNGPHAQSLADALAPLGMKLDVMSGEIGAAAAVKLCRSIVVKGLEALLFECVLAAGEFGADERVFASLAESYPGIDWPKLASYMVGRVVVHGKRRAHEMDEVAAMLREASIEPMMAEATARRQAWGGALKPHFGPDGPANYRDVLAVLRTATPSATQ